MWENEWNEKWSGSANEHCCHIGLILGVIMFYPIAQTEI